MPPGRPLHRFGPELHRRNDVPIPQTREAVWLAESRNAVDASHVSRVRAVGRIEQEQLSAHEAADEPIASRREHLLAVVRHRVVRTYRHRGNHSPVAFVHARVRRLQIDHREEIAL